MSTRWRVTTQCVVRGLVSAVALRGSGRAKGWPPKALAPPASRRGQSREFRIEERSHRKAAPPFRKWRERIGNPKASRVLRLLQPPDLLHVWRPHLGSSSANLLESSLAHMKVCYSRPVVSVALSCWLGFLACLLGCAQPALAAADCEQVPSGPNSGPATSNGGASWPCCNHGSGPSDGQGKNRRSAASCCPLDATLIQKHDLISPLSAGTYVAVPVSVSLSFPKLLLDSDENPPSTVWFAGRDILLQVHVLRI